MKEAPERVPNRNGLRYSASDKLKAVKLYLEEGYQVKVIARELGIGKDSLGKWSREYRENYFAYDNCAKLRENNLLK